MNNLPIFNVIFPFISPHPQSVKSLMEHPLFDWKNPNRVSSVVGAFAQCKEE